ncbi:hypothetical protein NQ318_010358 [Aromia moschata]|uniref:DUF4817 domain-containing protein n=1 Tax=Aromia moschata TaxID=1265417 RepID=A0AAV8Y967_9CUCU|nr:hypothetical protein NQ318_010358 [Aromia moschata]
MDQEIHEELLFARTLTTDTKVFVLQFRERVYLTEMHKITIMQIIGYGDRTRTQAEVIRLFQEIYPELPPISQGTVRKIEKQFLERGQRKNPPNKLSDDQKWDCPISQLLTLWESFPSIRVLLGTFDTETRITAESSLTWPNVSQPLLHGTAMLIARRIRLCAIFWIVAVE